MKRALLAISLFCAGLGGTIVAGECSTVQCVQNHAVVQQQFATQTLAAQPVVASATLLPLYGAGYSGSNGGGSADAETKELLKKLIEKIDQLGTKIDNIRGNPGGGPDNTQDIAVANYGQLLKTHCAKCHTGDDSKGDFQMFTDAGELIKQNKLSRDAIVDSINGRNKKQLMPPASESKLTPNQKQVIEAALKK